MAPALPLMKTKNIIYKAVIKELKNFQGESFKRKSTLVNFTSAIKNRIEKKIGEHYEKKSRQQYSANENSRHYN